VLAKMGITLSLPYRTCHCPYIDSGDSSGHGRTDTTVEDEIFRGRFLAHMYLKMNSTNIF